MGSLATFISTGAPQVWIKPMEFSHSIAREAVIPDERLFEQVYKKYFKDLLSYACAIVKDEAKAEGVVQNVFLKIWEKGDTLENLPNPAPYLYRSVHNMALNQLKHNKVKQAYDAYAVRLPMHDNAMGAAGKIQLSELQLKLNHALESLPEQCRNIFQMSRFSEMKYAEIADTLGISVKTVEAQMGKALRIMREKLADYLPILLLTILYLP
jgi:RNA polymerase sigma-70 factor (ECF subfamily)